MIILYGDEGVYDFFIRHDEIERARHGRLEGHIFDNKTHEDTGKVASLRFGETEGDFDATYVPREPVSFDETQEVHILGNLPMYRRLLRTGHCQGRLPVGEVLIHEVNSPDEAVE